MKKKIKDLLIGSNNAGKVRESSSYYQKILMCTLLLITSQKPKRNSVKLSCKIHTLNQSIFLKKLARFALDDSGLEIDILNKRPGIFSARWGGKNNNLNQAINRVFKELNKVDKNWKKKKIKARFICALTIYGPKVKKIHATGKIEGRISIKKIGKNGFGYDPIFIPNGEKITFGQMKFKNKFKIDHRAKAFTKLKKFL